MAEKKIGTTNSWLRKLRCPRCGGTALKGMPKRAGRWGVWGLPGVVCPACREKYPVTDGGVLRMIPKGDYSRYAYWQKMHAGYPVEFIVSLYKKRLQRSIGSLLSFYCMPRLAKKLGWESKTSLELGCQWGSNSLVMQQLGLTKEVWLLDISRPALRGALKFFKSFGLSPYAVQGEIHSLPFKKNAFDISFSGGLYEHFLEKEQEELVAENCRVSKKVICQVPTPSLAYKMYRALLTFKWGKWPFGLEVPVSKKRLKYLYEKAKTSVKAWDYHNLITALIMVAGDKRPLLRNVSFRPFWFYMFRHDAVIAVDTRERQKQR